MTKMKEQNSRSQRRRTAFCKREQNTKISFFAVRIFNLTRIEDFVNCQGGNTKNFFDATLSVQSREFFKNFSKIVTKYATRCHIQCAMMKKKQEEAKR